MFVAVEICDKKPLLVQVLEKDWIYVGIPAKKFKRNYFFEDGLEDKLGQVGDVEQSSLAAEMILRSLTMRTILLVFKHTTHPSDP